jgi:hypothetical protein
MSEQRHSDPDLEELRIGLEEEAAANAGEPGEDTELDLGPDEAEAETDLLDKEQEQAEELTRLRALQRQNQERQWVEESAQQAQSARAEFQRIQELPYDEQERYWQRQAYQQVHARAFQAADAEDRAKFAGLLKKEGRTHYAKQVEELLAQARQQGANVSREWVLNGLLGQERRSGGNRGGGRTESRGQPSPRRRREQDAADEELLRNISVADFTRAQDRF